MLFKPIYTDTNMPIYTRPYYIRFTSLFIHDGYFSFELLLTEPLAADILTLDDIFLFIIIYYILEHIQLITYWQTDDRCSPFRAPLPYYHIHYIISSLSFFTLRHLLHFFFFSFFIEGDYIDITYILMIFSFSCPLSFFFELFSDERGHLLLYWLFLFFSFIDIV